MGFFDFVIAGIGLGVGMLLIRILIPLAVVLFTLCVYHFMRLFSFLKDIIFGESEKA